MNLASLSQNLDAILPDDGVYADLRQVLASESKAGFTSVELDEGWALVPVDACLDIVTKAFFKEYKAGIGFGVFRILVAIGGFSHADTGFHQAGYCFATLYYNEECLMITADFHTEFR